MIYKNNFKFGMTNLCDAAVDLSWTKRIDSTIASVIISKSADKDFAKALLKYRDKIIYHVCITGFGGTELEPGTPTIDVILKHLKYIIDRGFNPKQIVLRIDPIMPYCWVDEINGTLKIDYLANLKLILDSCEKLGIKRVRHSFLNFHSCALKNLKNFNPSLVIPDDWKYNPDNEIPLFVLNNSFVFESKDLFNPYTNHIPPVSNEDLYVLGLNTDYRFDSLKDHANNILELLNCHNQCKMKCAYCNFEVPKKSFLDFSKKAGCSPFIKYDFGSKNQNCFGDYCYTYIAYASDNKGSNFSLKEDKSFLRWYAKIESPEKIENVVKEEFDRRSAKWIKYVFIDEIGKYTGDDYDIIDGFDAKLSGTIISADETKFPMYNSFDVSPKVKYGNKPYETQQWTYIQLNNRHFIGIKDIKVSKRMSVESITAVCQSSTGYTFEKKLLYNDELKTWIVNDAIFDKVQCIVKLKLGCLYSRYEEVSL